MKKQPKQLNSTGGFSKKNKRRKKFAIKKFPTNFF